MGNLRSKYQGVSNIIRFNWHFFVLGLIVCFGFISLYFLLQVSWNSWLLVVAMAIFFSIAISLITSWYIYDFAGLYDLSWLDIKNDSPYIANVNAGFDETTFLLRKLYPNAQVLPFDFYDKKRHTEVSIERARARYLPLADTIWLDSINPLLPNNKFDVVLFFMSLHEIRSKKERVKFLDTISNGLKFDAEIIVVEHLRDWKNMLAYNIGCFHFYSRNTWQSDFSKANLTIVHSASFTPFIRMFKLKRK